MRRIYSPNASYHNLWEQTHITPSEEFSASWGASARSIRSKDDLDKHLARHPGRHTALLDGLYSESNSILVLGAGDGINEIALIRKHRNKRIVLSDIAPEYLEKIHEHYGVEVLRMDSREISFPAGAFDLVYSLAAEYFFDDHDLAKMLTEMSRVVRAGQPVFISSVSVDFEHASHLEMSYRTGQRLIPPVPWVILHRLFLGRKIKLTGYSRTLDDFLRIFGRVRSLQLEGIYFDTVPGNSRHAPSVGFMLRKKATAITGEQ